MDEIRILIVDDHKLFRDGLSAILMKVPDIDVGNGCAVVREDAFNANNPIISGISIIQIEYFRFCNNKFISTI